MLVATSEVRIGAAGVRSTLLFERAVRGTVVRRESLAFDTKYAAAASGTPDAVGHLFLMCSGRWIYDTGETLPAPVCFVLADDEIERQTTRSRTFRTDGERVDVVQLRIAKASLRVPIGMNHGPLALAAPCWDAVNALVARVDAPNMAHLLDALASAGILDRSLTQTVIADEPERFRRLWAALEPLYSTYGATTSLKQLASSLGMSMRQVGRDAKEMSAAFGIGGGYRDALLLLRLRVAVLLLAAPEATVADVAKLVGYGSPIAMARAFRDARLPSPSAIQAALRGEPSPERICHRADPGGPARPPAILRIVARCCSLLLVLLFVGQARAGGFGIPEIGVRRTAMAAVIGRPDELSALYHNPAGLVLADEWRLYMSAGLSLLSTEFELSPWPESERFLGVTPEANGYYAPVKPSRAMGVVPMLAAGGHVWNKLYAGAALYVGNATGAAFDEDAVTHYHLIDGYIVAPQLVVAAAYKLRDDLALAVTAGVIHMRVHGKRYVFPIIDGNDISSLAGTKPQLVLDGQAWAPTWSLSAYGAPHPRVTWGAVLVGRVDATLEGPIEITYGEDASQPGDVLTGRQTTQQLLPWTLQAGANVDVTPNLELGGELRYWLYRQYERQHTDVVGIFLVRELNTEKNYSDSWEVAGGARVHDLAAAPGLDVMAGFNWDKSPAPPKTVTLDQPSFTHWGVHTGARYSLGRYRIGASYIFYKYQIPTITDSVTLPPSNVRGRGSNNIMTLSVEATI